VLYSSCPHTLSFLQFQARCLNPLQLQHSRFFFPSNFALNKVRVRFCLSKLLINVMSSGQGMEIMLNLAIYFYVCWGARSSSNQM